MIMYMYTTTFAINMYDCCTTDPHHVDLYTVRNTYLPVLNGISANASTATDYRTNFIQLERLVMIGGPQDGVITPWQSRWAACLN